METLDVFNNIILMVHGTKQREKTGIEGQISPSGPDY